MSMHATIVPCLTASGHVIDTSPERFGALESSINLLDDTLALRERMHAEGYLYLPGYLDRAEVLAARQEIAERLSAAGHTQPGTPPIELVARAALDIAFMPDLALDNPPLHQLLYSGRMMAFFAQFLGGEVRHYDFTWLRTVAPGRAAEQWLWPQRCRQVLCEPCRRRLHQNGRRRQYRAWRLAFQEPSQAAPESWRTLADRQLPRRRHAGLQHVHSAY